MGEFNLSKDQKKELKDVIEGEAQDHLQDEEEAKENLKVLSEVVENKYGIKKALFKKIAKALFLANIEEQTEAILKFKELYHEALGEADK